MPPQASDSPPEPFARPRFQDPGPSRLAKVQTITAHGLLTQASEDTQERAGRTGSVVSNLALAESRANVPCWGRWLLNVCPPLCQCACSLYAVVTTYRDFATTVVSLCCCKRQDAKYVHTSISDYFTCRSRKIETGSFLCATHTHALSVCGCQCVSFCVFVRECVFLCVMTHFHVCRKTSSNSLPLSPPLSRHMHACMRYSARTNTQKHTLTHTNTHSLTHAHAHAHIHTHTHTHIYIGLTLRATLPVRG